MLPTEQGMKSETEIRKLCDINSAPRCVLFVEDNLDDFSLACYALSTIKLRNRVRHVGSADEMLEYLRAMDRYLDTEKYPMPAVIVMDMHLPGPDGMEAQTMLRTNLRFRHIPIICISSSESLPQLQTAVDLGADAWMLKPFSAVQFLNIARDLKLTLRFENPVTRIEKPVFEPAFH
jgi:CheY-like chemotaxis protein